MKKNKTTLAVKITVNSSVNKAWNIWTRPEHIVNWNYASDEWHTPRAENDLRPGGRFVYRMEAKDGSFGFDFGGKYDKVKVNNYIEYTLDDDRKVKVAFTKVGEMTQITEVFETETLNSKDLQRVGWQSILNNFRIYTEKIK